MPNKHFAATEALGRSRFLDAYDYLREKANWQRLVLQDAALSLGARVIACQLMHDLNQERQCAWRSQASLAELLGINIRTVRRGIAELSKRGHLHVTPSKGRGSAIEYRALMPADGQGVGGDVHEMSANSERRTNDAPRNSPLSGEGSEPRTIDASVAASFVPSQSEDNYTPPSVPQQQLQGRMARQDEREASGTAADFYRDLAAEPQFGVEGARSVLHDAVHNPPGVLTVRSGWALNRLTRDARHLVQRWGVTVQVRQ